MKSVWQTVGEKYENQENCQRNLGFARKIKALAKCWRQGKRGPEQIGTRQLKKTKINS